MIQVRRIAVSALFVAAFSWLAPLAATGSGAFEMPSKGPGGVHLLAPAPAEEAAEAATALPPGVEAGWWAQVQETIRREEYEVAWEGQTCWSDLPGAYQAPNRAQGFQTFFTDAGIRLVPQSEEKPSWEWGLSFIGWGRNEGGTPAPSSAFGGQAPSPDRVQDGWPGQGVLSKPTGEGACRSIGVRP